MALLLEEDRGLRARLEGDVPFAHRTSARELDPVEDASHRWLGLAFDHGAQALVMAEPALPDRAHPEAQRDVDTEVSVEPLERLEFFGKLHGRWMATPPQELSRGTCTFGHLSPFPLSSARPIRAPVRSHGRHPRQFRGVGRASEGRPARMSGMRRAPPTCRRLRSMCRVRVFEMRMIADGTRPFQWKRSELNSRVRSGPVEGGLKEI